MRNTILFLLAFMCFWQILPAQVLQKGQAIHTFNFQNQVAEIIDVRNNSLACPGTNWDLTNCATAAAITQPSNWTSGRMGAIFGIAIDQKGDVFFAASPILGYALVSDTGIIFRADGANLNSVSNFIVNTNTYGSTLNTNKIPNNKKGFGNIAYDGWHNQLFATNLLDGKIYRISGVGATSGNVESVFTPPFNNFGGTINTPVQPGSICWGIGVNRDNDGVVRVYFSREMASPALSEVWSVELDGSGEFVPASAVMEFQGPNDIKITDLAFTPGTSMLIAERGGAHSSQVWEYHGTHLAWARENQKVDVGEHSSNDNCAGGVDYGYRQIIDDPMSLGECAKLIWASSNAIRLDLLAIYGICAIPTDPYPGTYLQNAIMVDMDGITSGGTKGRHGDVEIFRDPCSDRDICDYLSLSAKTEDDPAAGACCWKISLSNEYLDDYFTGIQFCGLNGVQLSYSGVLPTWDVVQHTPMSVTIAPHSGSLPIDNFPEVLQLCLSGYSTSPQQVVVKWLGPDPHQSVVCTDTLEFDCGTGGNPRCVRAVEDSLVCENGKYTYTFKVKNNAPFDVQSFVITPLDPNIQVTPALVNLAPPGILSGTTSGFYSVTLSGSSIIPGQPFCFYLTAHDQPVLNGNFPQACCTDSVLVDCLPIPDCDPCDGIIVSAKETGQPVPTGACCQSLSLTNNYLPGYFTGVQIVGLGGVQLSYVSGWAILPPVLPSSVTFIPPGGTLNIGAFNNFAEICLNGFSTATQQFVVNLLGPNGEVVCADTIITECPPPPPPTCAAAVKDSIWCDGGQVKYRFSLLNAPTNSFDIYSFNLLLADPVGIQVTQDYFVLGTPLLPGQTAGPFTIDLWGSSVQAGNPFCFVITAHDGVWGGDPAAYPTTCCTDSVAVRCLPIPDCSGQDSCCTPSGIQMPTGLSPNGDNLNDVFKILGTEKCQELSITVYNRWGNVVYQQDNYNNAWGGTNQSGADLPQGTYFVLLTLHDSGSTVSGYVDLRRY